MHPLGEIADPSPPWITPDGRVRLFGSADYALEFPTVASFFRGDSAAAVPLRLRHPDGTAILGAHCAWDVNLSTWNELPDGSREVLYAGVMTPTEGRPAARWPDDNWTRRVYAFRPDGNGYWVREPTPLVGPPAHAGWVGHSYGHHLLRHGGNTWLFYERVREERRSGDGHLLPYLTEIFARKMSSPFRAEEEEIPILSVGQPPERATYRRDWITDEPSGYLVEGPRPVPMRIEGHDFFILGFSSGDFPTDHYGLNVAWSRNPLGPYRPVLDEHGDDFLDLGRELKQKHGLSWGPARPTFLADTDGEWWVLFHAVAKRVLPDRDYSRWPREPLTHFHRNVYLARVEAHLSAEGEPRLTLLG